MCIEVVDLRMMVDATGAIAWKDCGVRGGSCFAGGFAGLIATWGEDAGFDADTGSMSAPRAKKKLFGGSTATTYKAELMLRVISISQNSSSADKCR